ncbi:hypothetical protein [Trichormus sp. NMC-1]|uniref:hypothetical protein n=1 Tax=Trichormus sp. NMC-1 TaxID=1853259 RepID=UPI0015A62FFE|nr:hypothetical protein [Trichormus sp. NMC-1]
MALTGSSYGEIEPQKATYLQAGRNTQPLTSLELIPAALFDGSGKSPGNPMVEMASAIR